MSDTEYDALKPIVEHLYGHWRERTKCFVFPYDVRDLLPAAIEKGVPVTDEYLWQEETQFYPTPAHVARRLADLAEIFPGCTLLEPSAGAGNLLEAVHQNCRYIAVEPLHENVVMLNEKGYNALEMTFEEFLQTEGPHVFDRVLMNPPFAGQNDAIHVMKAYELLNPGGVLAAIISENALYYKTPVSEEFRLFLREHNAYLEAVPSGAFTGSGTTIETVIVRIKKKAKEC